MGSEQWRTQKDGDNRAAEDGGRFDRFDRRRVGAAWDGAGTCLAGQVAAAGDVVAGNDPDQVHLAAMGAAECSQGELGDRSV